MVFVVLIAGAAAASSAVAGQPAPEAAVPPPKAIVVTGEPKRICETSASLGSIIPSRVCKTQEEWDAIHERSLVALGRMQDDQVFRDNAQRHKAQEGPN